MYQLSTFQFPKDFKFGVTYADFQVIREQKTIKSEVSETIRRAHLTMTSGKVYNEKVLLEEIDCYNQ